MSEPTPARSDPDTDGPGMARDTMRRSMAPRRADDYKLEIDPAYRRELARRCEALGLRRVAVKAKVGRMTLWRLLNAPQGQPSGTIDAAERVRRAVMDLDPDGAPIPPPVLPVRGPSHPTWRAGLQAERKRR